MHTYIHTHTQLLEAKETELEAARLEARRAPSVEDAKSRIRTLESDLEESRAKVTRTRKRLEEVIRSKDAEIDVLKASRGGHNNGHVYSSSNNNNNNGSNGHVGTVGRSDEDASWRAVVAAVCVCVPEDKSTMQEAVLMALTQGAVSHSHSLTHSLCVRVCVCVCVCVFVCVCVSACRRTRALCRRLC
jgi:hypothetical protein